MFYITVFLFLLFENAYCNLWSKGVVHYSVNPKDYDPHSQDVIITTLQKIQNEICVKFFSTPVNYTAEKGEKILHIHNPQKLKTCSPQTYDFTKDVIEMPVGYKCLNERDITKLMVEMLKASIHKSQPIINSEDLIQKFQEKDRLENPEKVTLLSPNDRNYINAHYFQECGGLTQRSAPSRRHDIEEVGSEYLGTGSNRNYYRDKIWPLGFVVYDIKTELRLHQDFKTVLAAMRTIELYTCILFQEDRSDDVLNPKSKIVFAEEGEDWPHFGYYPGVQTLKLSSIANPMTPGHKSHTLMMLLRIAGVPMMSNRYDRDNYVKVHWKNVKKGMEFYLEKAPEAAWIKQLPYDFYSVTHAPATFLCPDCITAYTVEPVQDHLWQRTLTMGRAETLSVTDIQTINTIYTEQCQNRVLPMAKDRVALAGNPAEDRPLGSSLEQENPLGSDTDDQSTDQSQDMDQINYGNGTRERRYSQGGPMIRKPASDDGIPEKSRGTFENRRGD